MSTYLPTAAGVTFKRLDQIIENMDSTDASRCFQKFIRDCVRGGFTVSLNDLALSQPIIDHIIRHNPDFLQVLLSADLLYRPERIYSIGDMFRTSHGELRILATVAMNSVQMVGISRTECGWNHNIVLVRDPHHITEDEFEAITGGVSYAPLDYNPECIYVTFDPPSC